MLRMCAQLRRSACPCSLSISFLNSHLNQFSVYRDLQPSNQLQKNSNIPSNHAFHSNCCASTGEQPFSISTAAATDASLSTTLTDEHYMELALDQARLAYEAGEVPVGAVIVSSTGDVLAAAHNVTERDGDPTAHAEMLCIRHATGKTKSAWRLLDATMYVTLEPCPMCAGALLQSRVGRVVYGARNNLLGADGSWINMMRGGRVATGATVSSPRLEISSENSNCTGNDEAGEESCTYVVQPHRPHPFHPDLQVDTGVLEEQCSALMKEFFKERRRQNAQKSG
jgi:tRNA(adenine34) deaminase